MTERRTFSLIMKLRLHTPAHEADFLIARQALEQEAEEHNHILSGAVRCSHAAYSAQEGLYVAVFVCEGIPLPMTTRYAGPRTAVGTPCTVAEAMAVRAHYTPLRSAQIRTDAVQAALDAEDPREGALRALIALHLLGMPVDSNLNAGRAARALGRVFGPADGNRQW